MEKDEIKQVIQKHYGEIAAKNGSGAVEAVVVVALTSPMHRLQKALDILIRR